MRTQVSPRWSGLLEQQPGPFFTSVLKLLVYWEWHIHIYLCSCVYFYVFLCVCVYVYVCILVRYSGQHARIPAITVRFRRWPDWNSLENPFSVNTAKENGNFSAKNRRLKTLAKYRSIQKTNSKRTIKGNETKLRNEKKKKTWTELGNTCPCCFHSLGIWCFNFYLFNRGLGFRFSLSRKDLRLHQ